MEHFGDRLIVDHSPSSSPPELSTIPIDENSDQKFTAVKVDLTSLSPRRRHVIVIISRLTSARELSRAAALKAGMQESQVALMQLVASVDDVTSSKRRPLNTELFLSPSDRPLDLLEVHANDAVHFRLQWKSEKEVYNFTVQPLVDNKKTVEFPTTPNIANLTQSTNDNRYDRSGNFSTLPSRTNLNGSTLPGYKPYPSTSALDHINDQSKSSAQIPFRQVNGSDSDCLIHYESTPSLNINNGANNSLNVGFEIEATPRRTNVVHSPVASRNSMKGDLGGRGVPTASEAVLLANHLRDNIEQQQQMQQIYDYTITSTDNSIPHPVAIISKSPVVPAAAASASSRVSEPLVAVPQTTPVVDRINFDPRETRNSSLPNIEQLKDVHEDHTAGDDGRNEMSLTISSDPGASSASMSCLNDSGGRGSGAGSGGSTGSSTKVGPRRFLPALGMSDEIVEEKLNSLSEKLERKLKVKSKDRSTERRRGGGGKKDGLTAENAKESYRQMTMEDVLRSLDISKVGLDPELHRHYHHSPKEQQQQRNPLHPQRSLTNGTTLPGSDSFSRNKDYEIHYSNDALHQYLPDGANMQMNQSRSKTVNKGSAANIAAMAGVRALLPPRIEFDDTMSMTSLEVAGILATAEPLAPPADDLYEEPSSGDNGVEEEVRDDDSSGTYGSDRNSPVDLSFSDSSTEEEVDIGGKRKSYSSKHRHAGKHGTVNAVRSNKIVDDGASKSCTKVKNKSGPSNDFEERKVRSHHSSKNNISESVRYPSKHDVSDASRYHYNSGSSGVRNGTGDGESREKVLSLYLLVQTRQLYSARLVRDSPGRRLAFEVFNDVLYLETMTSSRGGGTSMGLANETREIVKQRFTVPVVGEVRLSGGQHWRCVHGEVKSGDIIVEVNGVAVLSQLAMSVVEICRQSTDLDLVIARPRNRSIDDTSASQTRTQTSDNGAAVHRARTQTFDNGPGIRSKRQ